MEKLWSFSQFVFIVCQDESYGNILKLSFRSLVFTSYLAFTFYLFLKNISLKEPKD